MRPVKSATSTRRAQAQGEPVPATMAGWAKRHGWLLAALLLVVVFLAANYKLVAGKALPLFDANVLFLPDFVLQADSVRAGRLLLWNPWTAGGSPTSADPQTVTYSPIATFIGWMTGGTERGFCAYWLSIWLLAGVGMLALGRQLGAPAWGALAAALGYIFSGFFIGNAEHTSLLYTMALFPFVIWRLDAALQRRRLGPAVQAGALWGLSAPGGYPALNILGGCFAALWILGRLLFGYPENEAERSERSLPPPHSRGGHWSFGLAALAVLALVGILVLSPVYVGFFTDGAGYTDRTGALARETATGADALHPRALTTFASPYLPDSELQQPEFVAVHRYLHVQHLPPGGRLLAGAVAPVLQPRQRWRWWLAGLGARQPGFGDGAGAAVPGMAL